MKELIARTRDLFAEGMPLASVDARLRVDLELFSDGGLAVLNAIERIGYNTLEHSAFDPGDPVARLLRVLACAFASRNDAPRLFVPLPRRPGSGNSWANGCTMLPPPRRQRCWRIEVGILRGMPPHRARFGEQLLLRLLHAAEAEA